MGLTVLVGNPKPASRTLQVAVAVASALRELLALPEPAVVDLADIAGGLFGPAPAQLEEALATVSQSTLVVVASPTYKATYTGLLKAFLDRYGNNALVGTTCVPLMTGAAPIHALAPEAYLRPLLVELGASVPTRGLYVTEDQFGSLADTIATWLSSAGPLLRRALGQR